MDNYVQYKANKTSKGTSCRKIVEHFISLTVLQHLDTELNFLCFQELKTTNESNIRQMCMSNIPGHEKWRIQSLQVYA